MNKLIENIRKVVPIDSATESAITERVKIEKLSKGKILLKENSICNKMWFIESGMIRQYMFIDGVDVTKWFYVDNQWATSQFSYFGQKPSFDYLEIYEDSIIHSLSFDDENALLEYPQYQKFQIILLRQYLANLNYIMRNYKQMTIDEKYRFLLENHPEVVQRVKLKEIASLIGISQETLSRVRARI